MDVLNGCAYDFEGLDLRKTKDAMRAAIIVDGRRIFSAEATERLGFIYRGVGAGNK